jgi:hypothetical protein
MWNGEDPRTPKMMTRDSRYVSPSHKQPICPVPRCLVLASTYFPNNTDNELPFSEIKQVVQKLDRFESAKLSHICDEYLKKQDKRMSS